MVNPFEKFLTKEDLLQRAVVNYIRLQYPKAFMCHIPNEGKRTKFEQFKAKVLGIVSGMPDVMIFNPGYQKTDGIFDGIKFMGLAIELKIKPNKPSPAQISVLNNLKVHNWSTHVCYSFDEVKAIVHDYFRS